jgi:hypothetical protein
MFKADKRSATAFYPNFDRHDTDRLRKTKLLNHGSRRTILIEFAGPSVAATHFFFAKITLSSMSIPSTLQ